MVKKSWLGRFLGGRKLSSELEQVKRFSHTVSERSSNIIISRKRI